MVLPVKITLRKDGQPAGTRTLNADMAEDYIREMTEMHYLCDCTPASEPGTDYHEYGTENVGGSNIASLLYRFGGEVEGGSRFGEIHFGGDFYDCHAYVVDENAKIGDHYHLVAEGTSWLMLYDDDTKRADVYADRIKIYRAADMGLIIQLIGRHGSDLWGLRW